jgi:F0F1-type ATP synthase membrane subunit c/vacuolar-type H+-ATPase subunit K
MADHNAEEPETRIRHPNQEKSSSQVAKAFVGLLLVASAVLIALVTIGGWSVLQGAQIVSVMYFLVYLVMAYYVMKWSRGVLPLAAALAVGLGVFAAIAAAPWFDRAHANYADPALPPRLLGLLTILTMIVQIILIIAAMIAFQQKWNIEVEEQVDEDDGGGQQGYGGGGRTQAAGATG